MSADKSYTAQLTKSGSPVQRARQACFEAFENYHGEPGGDYDAAADAAVRVVLEHLLTWEGGKAAGHVCLGGFALMTQPTEYVRASTIKEVLRELSDLGIEDA